MKQKHIIAGFAGAAVLLAALGGGAYLYVKTEGEKRVRDGLETYKASIPADWSTQYGAVRAGLPGNFTIDTITLEGPLDNDAGNLSLSIDSVTASNWDYSNEIPNHLSLQLNGIRVNIDDPEYPAFLRDTVYTLQYGYRFEPESQKMALESLRVGIGEMFTIDLSFKLANYSKDLIFPKELMYLYTKAKGGQKLSGADQENIKQVMKGNMAKLSAILVEEAKVHLHNTSLIKHIFEAEAKASGKTLEETYEEALEAQQFLFSQLKSDQGMQMAKAVRDWIQGNKENLTISLIPEKAISPMEIGLLAAFASSPGGEEELFKNLGLNVVAE